MKRLQHPNELVRAPATHCFHAPQNVHFDFTNSEEGEDASCRLQGNSKSRWELASIRLPQERNEK